MTVNMDIRRNTVWSCAEVIVSGISLLVLYKFIVMVLGVKAVGIWSLVLATTSLARLADIGGGAGLSRFVALAAVRKESELAKTYVDTAFLSNLIFFCFLAALLYWPFNFALSVFIDAESLSQAQAVLPFAMVSLVLLNLNSIVLSALIGFHRADLKSKVVIFSCVIQVCLSVALISRFGLLGLALGQISQYILSIVIGLTIFYYLLQRKVRFYLPKRFSRSSFAELFKFGLKLQAANLISFVFEPATKFVMSSIGGLETLGLFELAYRLAFQARGIVAAPMQSLLPAFVHLGETSSLDAKNLYNRATVNAAIFGGPLLLGVVLFSPLVSKIWLGAYNWEFIIFTISVSLGWLVNLIGAPAYIFGMSRGYLRGNIGGHLITSIGSPALGYIAGSWWGPIGVASAASAALAGGAVFSMVMNCSKYGLRAIPSGALFLETLNRIIRSTFRGFREILGLAVAP